MGKRWLCVLFFITGIFYCAACTAQINIITTFAGDSIGGYSGDDSLATHASLVSPSGVATDRHGNVYIVDQNNNRCRKVNAAGIITTIAGIGTSGYTGDSSLATAAQLYWPTGVAVDGHGNVYIADQFNDVIRKIDTTGIITTIAGNGSAGYSGDSGLATAAQLWHPADVGVDSAGNVYIADQDNNRIRKVNTSGIITTIAGTGIAGYNGDSILADSAELNFPQGIAVDKYGNIFIADFYNSRIRKIDTAGMITTVAGNGAGGYSGDDSLATLATLFDASAVAVDDTGNLYISDYYNSRIRKVNSAGIITTIAGNGVSGYGGDNDTATAGEINYPEGVAVDTSGNIFIADFNNSRVRKVAKDTTMANTTEIHALTAPSFNLFPNPSGRFFDLAGNNGYRECHIVVYNVLGQQVYRSVFNSENTVIDLAGKPLGVYTLYISCGDERVARQLILADHL